MDGTCDGYSYRLQDNVVNIICSCVGGDTRRAMYECREDRFIVGMYLDLKKVLQNARSQKFWIDSEQEVDSKIVRDGAIDPGERLSAIRLGVDVRQAAFDGRYGVSDEESRKPYVIRCGGRCVGRLRKATPTHIARLLPLLFDGHSTYGSDVGYSQGDYENRRRLSGYDQCSVLQVLQDLLDLSN
jgi:hypothetical protein